MAATVFVALEGWGSDDEKQKSAEAGIDGRLTKPADLDAVQAIFSRFSTTSAVDDLLHTGALTPQ